VALKVPTIATSDYSGILSSNPAAQ
jgi:hypothetical protein